MFINIHVVQTLRHWSAHCGDARYRASILPHSTVLIEVEPISAVFTARYRMLCERLHWNTRVQLRRYRALSERCLTVVEKSTRHKFETRKLTVIKLDIYLIMFGSTPSLPNLMAIGNVGSARQMGEVRWKVTATFFTFLFVNWFLHSTPREKSKANCHDIYMKRRVPPLEVPFMVALLRKFVWWSKISKIPRFLSPVGLSQSIKTF
jgi:hypothetical protein